MNGSSMTKDATATEPKRANAEQSRLVWESPRLFLTSLPALTLCAISSVGIVAAFAPQGFLAMNESVRTQLDVFSRRVQSRNGRDVPADMLPAGTSREVLDYQLLQYDLLLGNAYAAEWLAEQD